jgi:hypothetical protein
MDRAGRIRAGSLVIATLLVGLLVNWPAGGQQAHAQQQGIRIAGASPTSPLQLGRGCNQVIADSPNGAKVAALVGLITPADAAVSVWHFSNATKQYQAGWFADQRAPTDFSLLGAASPGRWTDSFMVCVNKSALIVAT